MITSSPRATLCHRSLSLFCAGILAASAASTSAAAAPAIHPHDGNRNKIFSCTGHEEQIADGYPPLNGPATAVLQVKNNIVRVDGAWPFTADEIAISREDDVQVHFSRMIGKTAFGDAGVFNKVNGKLRLDVTSGVGDEPQKVRVHWSAEYVCRPTKPML